MPVHCLVLFFVLLVSVFAQASQCDRVLGLIASTPSIVDKQNQLTEMKAQLVGEPQNGDLYLQAGLLALDLKQAENAIDLLHSAIGLQGPNELNLEALGRAFVRARLIESARQVQEVLGKQYPFGRGDYHLSFDIAKAERKWRESSALADKWVRAFPDDEDAVYHQISEYFRGRSELADAKLKEILWESPFNERALDVKINDLVGQKNTWDAYFLGRTILSLKPYDGRSLSATARHHLKGGDLEKAEIFARRFYQAEPRSKSALELLSRILIARGQIDEAEPLIAELKFKQSILAPLYEVKILLRRGKVADAKKRILELFEVDPHNALAHKARIQIALAAGQLGEVLENVTPAGQDDEVLTMHTLALIGLGKISDAHKVIKQLVRRNDELGVYAQLASKRFSSEDLPEPVSNAPHIPLSSTLKALQSWRSEKWAHVQSTLEERLQVDPHDDAALLLFALLNMKNGNWEAVGDLLAKVSDLQSSQAFKVTESLLLARAHFEVHNVRFDEAAHTYLSVLKKPHLTPRARRQALRGLVEIAPRSQLARQLLQKASLDPAKVGKSDDDLLEISLCLVHLLWVRDVLPGFDR